MSPAMTISFCWVCPSSSSSFLSDCVQCAFVHSCMLIFRFVCRCVSLCMCCDFGSDRSRKQSAPTYKKKRETLNKIVGRFTEQTHRWRSSRRRIKKKRQYSNIFAVLYDLCGWFKYIKYSIWKGTPNLLDEAKKNVINYSGGAKLRKHTSIVNIT